MVLVPNACCLKLPFLGCELKAIRPSAKRDVNLKKYNQDPAYVIEQRVKSITAYNSGI
jgi:hypothetical protein